MTSRALIYYECLKQPLDAGYGTPFDHLAQKTNIINLDSFSQSAQFELTRRAIEESEKVLIIVDSQKGSETTGLFPLINQLMDKNGSLIWIGDHDLRQKAIVMTNGKLISSKNILEEVASWLNQA